MAYEVIKNVSGRAYRYRVESYRDPETRRVRGKWTYLGRVEGQGTLSPEHQARRSSHDRLLDAVERLLESNELGAISTGMVASEAGLAYGTFYRHFRDLGHVVRDAMARQSANLELLGERFGEPSGDRATERARFVTWVRESIAAVLARPGLFRAWEVTSNQFGPVALERQRCFDASVEQMAGYLERLHAAGVSDATPAFAAYAIVALLGAATREAAVDKVFSEAKREGIISVVTDLAGL